LVTNEPPLPPVWKAPAVVGKSDERVRPKTYADPAESIARLCPSS
jgi:hypothetical protein